MGAALLQGRNVGDRLRIVAKIDETRTLYVLGLVGLDFGHGDFVRGDLSALAPTGDSVTVQKGNRSVEMVVDARTRFARRIPGGEASILFGDLTIGDKVVVLVERTEDPNHPVRAKFVLVKNGS